MKESGNADRKQELLSWKQACSFEEGKRGYVRETGKKAVWLEYNMQAEEWLKINVDREPGAVSCRAL